MGEGSAGKGRGFDAWDYPRVGLLIVRSDPRGRDIWLWPTEAWYSEAVTKSVPRGFLKVTLLEKSMKLIMSILRKVLSSSSHLIVQLDWNRVPPWKSEDFLQVTDPTCSDMLSRCYKAFYVLLILHSTVNLPEVILLFKIRDARGERKYFITASNLMELPLTVNKSSNNVFEMFFYSFYIVL